MTMGNQNNNHTEYEDVPSVDDLDQEDVEQRPRRTRRSPSAPLLASSTGYTSVLYLLIVLLLGAVAAVLLVYRRQLTYHEAISGPPSASVDRKPEPLACDSASTPLAENRHYTVHYRASAVDSRTSAYDFDAIQPVQPAPGTKGLGYLMQPSIYNESLVFVAEGDLYYTRLGSSMPAMKLTTTDGNVRTPRIFGNQIVYTATYDGRRDVYRMDLATSTTRRLTYLETEYGVRSIAGWLPNGRVLITASSLSVSLPDTRLYQLDVETGQRWNVPLAQAIDGDRHGDCLYFTRFMQSSQTARYVGGTAESIWMYCDNATAAVDLTADYNGTSKAPVVAEYHGQAYLLFLSDRSRRSDGEWRPTSMNLWAVPVPGANGQVQDYRQLTRVSCQFEGRALREFAVDPITGNVVLRIGGDLYQLTADQMQQVLSGTVATAHPKQLPIQVYSDFHEQQERLISVNPSDDMQAADVWETAFGTVQALLTLRGQAWVVPVLESALDDYQGAGQNLPPRRYRVAPGAMTGGSLRILKALVVPLLPDDQEHSQRRVAVVLATDPTSPTAEHAFYLIEIQSDLANAFVDLMSMPTPFLGGHTRTGGSTAEGGLGSIYGRTMTVSPCGRRMAWADTDGRIGVMTLPLYTNGTASYTVLPADNELGEPLDGSLSMLKWSPGGRYLAIEHFAKNQFAIVSIADCGDPMAEDGSMVDIKLGRIVQATPSRFNSNAVYWGKSTLDLYLEEKFALLAKLTGSKAPEGWATTLYFLTDRDIISDVYSPWGTRAPSPHFTETTMVYALPLKSVDEDDDDSLLGRFAGGGALEVFVEDLQSFQKMLDDFEAKTADDDSARRVNEVARELKQTLRSRRLRVSEKATVARYLKGATERRRVDAATTAAAVNATTDDSVNGSTDFPKNMAIDFGPTDLTFARQAYRIVGIPKGKYQTILSQASDDGSLVVIEISGASYQAKIFSVDSFPSDKIDPKAVSRSGRSLDDWGLSTSGDYIYLTFSPDGLTKIIANQAPSLAGFLLDEDLEENLLDTRGLAVSVWPALEYQQMYSDAWRMLRDYFYDRNMHGVDWPAIHERYLPLVQRCAKREDLDDIMAQMAAELSALHVFVYGGEYNGPFGDGDDDKAALHVPGSLGVGLERAPEWNGYRVTEVPEVDPDFSIVDSTPVFCPLSEQTLRLTGQKGLQVGDIIVGINGESVLRVPDIHLLLRGTSGRSVRLEVLRLASGSSDNSEEAQTEAVITTPISPDDAANVRYHAWEWRTRQKAKELAGKAGFSVAYVHMRAMGRDDEDSFARSYFPDYDKQALIVDVRHNNGGNIDSWILDVLQRKAWMYWRSRNGMRRGDMDWDEQFAFRGHIVVLIDEHTASDGEGLSRGMSELGLGRLIGKRTWGGGIWLSSDNRLVDGGIATAPEYATFNKNFGYGLGIEQQGVKPDIEVDNNPRTTYDGHDSQLEKAIEVLKKWIAEEPVVIPKPPANMKDMSLHEDDCPA